MIRFKKQIGDLGITLRQILTDQLTTHKPFKKAFEQFSNLCRDALNPKLTDATILDMLAQHLLTERLFQTMFNNPEFRTQNRLAKEIEKVVAKLTSKSFNRDEFLKRIDNFYVAFEQTAATLSEYSHKQEFLNVGYEKFFQSVALKVADTYGIVYTPQPIVEFMVHSVEEILQQEFQCSLSSPGVHILDPFVGTGNFLLRVLHEINPSQLEQKYREELHCYEVMLLPYYLACANIEQAFYERTEKYLPFTGISLVDTFELVEEKQPSLLADEKTTPVERQKKAKILVILGNPPYHVGQQDENDNNKNRKYPVVDGWVKEHYAKPSKATSVSKLNDPYVKAFAWATEKLKDSSEGIIAFVTNNGFLDNIAFDGMREHLAQTFSKIYLLDLGGNVRKTPGAQNVFGVRVGVSINLLVKKTTHSGPLIQYVQVGDHLSKQEKLDYLVRHQHIQNLTWQRLVPDSHHTWLSNGLQPEFQHWPPLVCKANKTASNDVIGTLFKKSSLGIATHRDAWVYNFNRALLATNMQRTIEAYNEQVFKWLQVLPKPTDPQALAHWVDNWVSYEDTKLSWGESLKANLQRGKLAEFHLLQIRHSLYRPFTQSYLYFDRMFNDRVYGFPAIFPTPATELENRVICVSGVGSGKPFQTLMVNMIPGLDFLEKTQCFPFYTYSEGGSTRYENLTDWALQAFCDHYQNHKLTKWDIFYYVYGLLQHPGYREKYAANLKRELPRMPYTSDFWAFAKAGQQLADLHLHYETQPEYPLQLVTKAPLNWRVEKMKLSKDKTTLIYNDTLSLIGIPPETFEYHLRNRSALESVLDQYQVRQDKRSGIINDPNRLEEEKYIVQLIKRVITVSIKTVEIVKGLPGIE